MFVIIEGIDGVGKTSLARKLCVLLNKYKKTYYTDQFDTKYGQGVRYRFLHDQNLSIRAKMKMIRACRRRWINEKISTINLNKSYVIVDRYYQSIIAYQGYEGVIPINSPVFDEELSIANDLYFTSIMIYVRAKNPKNMITNPADYIEKRGGLWQAGVQDRFDRLNNTVPYCLLNTVVVHVDENHNFDLTAEEIAWQILDKESSLLDNREAMRLRRSMKMHHIYRCMRKAKKQIKLPL